MEAKYLINKIKGLGIKLFTGVPDSLLKHFCYELELDNEIQSITAANEGASIAIAAGEYLSTNIPACVYLQNSGLGNTINPLISLMSEAVYNIPLLMVIGWRGEPGLEDEPQHSLQGELTKQTLEMMNIEVFEITKETSNNDLDNIFKNIETLLKEEKRVSLLVRRGALTSKETSKSKKEDEFKREDAIKLVVDNVNNKNLFVSTTGKISRELYELTKDTPLKPFLTVGSMGHASMIALGIANNDRKNKIYCLDGDGATLMHMGSLATIGDIAPKNYYHILLNNNSHESVGNMPTTSSKVNFIQIAEAVGYKKTFLVDNEKDLVNAIKYTQEHEGPIYIEVKVGNTSRDDLSRPKETPIENKKEFMKFIGVEK